MINAQYVVKKGCTTIWLIESFVRSVGRGQYEEN